MNKRILALLTLLCLLFAYVQSYAQQTVDDSTIGVDSSMSAASVPDMPVEGIGDSLAKAYTDFIGAIVDATNGMGSALTGSFRGLAYTVVALYIAITSLRMIKGETQAPKRAVTTMFLTVLVTQIVFGPGQFQEYVSGPIIDTIKGLGDFLVSRATGAQAGSGINALSGGMDKVMAACVQLDRASSFFKPQYLIPTLIAQIALTGTYLLVMTVFLLINLMTWFGIYLLNVFGAVCLFFAIYNPTRHIFWAWLRAMCNYGLVIVFAALILAVCLKIMGPQLDKLAVMDYGSTHPLFNKPTYTCIAINILSWCMLLRAPDFAAALSGGSAGNTAGIAGVVSMTAGAVYGGAKWSAGRIMGRAGGWSSGGAAPGGGRAGAFARNTGRAFGDHGQSASARKGIENN